MEIRRLAVTVLETENATLPFLVNRVVRESLTTLLSRDKQKTTNGTATDIEDQALHMRQERLVFLLSACAAFAADAPLADKQSLIAELVILAHHSDICELL